MSNSVVLVQYVQLDLAQSFLVATELVQVIPSHGVHVSQCDLASERRMVLVQKREEVLKPEKVLLLNDLGIDMWRSKSLDLSDKIIADAFDSLTSIS